MSADSEATLHEEVPLVHRPTREEEVALATPFRAWSGVPVEDNERAVLF